MANACALVQGDAHTALHTFPAHRISNKVDVWSAGVILYQMLFGRRPFGEGMTQEQILRDRVMLNAREVGGLWSVGGGEGQRSDAARGHDAGADPEGSYQVNAEEVG